MTQASVTVISHEPYRFSKHYIDVIMTTMASQITSLTVVYSTVYSDVDQRKHQSSASLAFVRGIHRGPVNSPHIGPVTRKMFPFHDVIMTRATRMIFQDRAQSNIKWDHQCMPWHTLWETKTPVSCGFTSQKINNTRPQWLGRNVTSFHFLELGPCNKLIKMFSVFHNQICGRCKHAVVYSKVTH